MVGFVSYNIENDKQFKSNLDKAIKSVGDIRFALGEISRDIYKNTRKNFTLAGDGKYPPLSSSYKEYKNKVKPNAPILVFSGNLRDSVTKPRDEQAIRQIGNKSLVQGTSVPYARFVQEGTRKMPARKFLFIDDAQALRFTRIIEDDVASKLEVIGDVK